MNLRMLHRIAILSCAGLVSSACNAQQGAPVSFRGLTANTTIKQAISQGIVNNCRISDENPSEVNCSWVGHDFGKWHYVIYEENKLKYAAFAFDDNSNRKDQAIPAEVAKAEDGFRKSGGVKCPITEHLDLPPSGEVHATAQWCFSDAAIVTYDTTWSFLSDRKSRLYSISLTIK